ncbi:uncharacterized protein LOC141865791 [Acropora palmata]|uniref:uncharacterized protein LOC141865791 n=1 Tax=Acropora palmata TaxID=6131 RepID=UPI003DA050CD
MPKEKLDSLSLKQVLKPTQIVPFNHSVSSSKSIKQKKADFILEECTPSLLPTSNKLYDFEIGNGLDDFEGLPLIVRKDRLVQEIENSLAEIEDHYSNTTKLEEERTVFEMERNNLLKDIEEAITEIQNHVLNSHGLEHEKGVFKEECDGLRDQVDQLKNVLGSSTGLEIGSNSDELEKLALKQEINSLTLENENLKIKVKDADEGEVPSDMMSRELELLRDENSNLQKLLQMAEESEEHMGKELESCQAKLSEIQKQNNELTKENKRLATEKEQLELDQEDLEEELYSLQTRLMKSKDQNQNDFMLKESKEEFAKSQRACNALEKENNVLKKKIEQFEEEIKRLQRRQEEGGTTLVAATKTSENNEQQLKSALEKLNKETSSLHESLDKAETEIENLKDELKREREEKEKLKAASSDTGKKKKSKKGKEKDSESGKENEGKVDEVETFKKEIYNLTSECQALSETIARTANEKRKLLIDVEALTEEKNKLGSKVEELEGVVPELTKLKSENEELKGSYSNLKVFHDDLAQKLEIAKKSNAEKEEGLKRTLLEKDVFERRLKEFEETVEHIRKELQTSQQNFISKNDELKTLQRKFEEQNNKFSTTSEGSRKEREKLRNEVREISEMLKSKDEEMGSVRKTLEGRDSELQNMRITVDEMRKELTLTKNNLRESEKAKLDFEQNARKAEQTVDELQKSSAGLNDLVMERSLELSRTRRTLEKKVEKLTKENAEMRKKYGFDVPSGSTTPTRLSPVTVQMQKDPNLDVNLEHFSRPSRRTRNDETKRPNRDYSSLSSGTISEGTRQNSRDYSPSSRGITANRPTTDTRVRRSSDNNNAASDRQTHESEFAKQSRENGVPNARSFPPEYRVIASEILPPSPKREFTSSVVHVASSSVRDQSPMAANRDTGFNQRRDEEWNRNGRRFDELRQDDRERRSSGNSNHQDSDEATFQVVGYRQSGGDAYEHWV